MTSTSTSTFIFAVTQCLLMLLIWSCASWGESQAQNHQSKDARQCTGLQFPVKNQKFSSTSNVRTAGVCENNLGRCGGSKDHQSVETMASSLLALEFEVFGRVQGVFFRKYTVKKGKELGLRGWCKNTIQGTVLGEIEGVPAQVNQMKEWLTNTGSPQSGITKTEFRNVRNIEEYRFDSFDVRK